jgi:hypothetical protein
MSNSYRIRTKPGVDSSVRVLIDQEFEYLEILSLKILQNQIYTRQCSDYGVIVGRVSVNNGFGIPNAKVSVFIPLEDIDENDPVISDLYPYKSLTDLNDDGYRYNLLPYKQQHGGHTPTGTFFTREDVLTNPTLIEVYDKYYKFNAVTNESGDYMIFGVPTGSQTIVVDVDLSDIGEFSLSPQDLIRMGIATENQISGTKFKSSTNLRELPQILTFNRTIEVEPLWGQPDICNLGITRTDFDVSAESNVNITPTSVFMGSLVSSNDDNFLKKNCKSKPTAGNLCQLTTGPGEILAIRQTIQQDVNGRPILEEFELEQGGQVIDDNGTWLIDVPMNMNYVTTNEFGEKVISSDPKVGIPTKSKYRFKVKWNQSPSLSADPIKRGYYLVPNIKEYGWGETDSDGEYLDPLQDSMSNSVDTQNALNSYAFSLDWNDYGDNDMIQEAINCEDRFFEMSYNKVYTISQMISQYRRGYGDSKIISIKNILDPECESDNNRFPTNDSVYKFDFLYLLFRLMLLINTPTLYLLLIVAHVLAFFILVVTPLLLIITAAVLVVVAILCPIIGLIIDAINLIPGVNVAPNYSCPSFSDYTDTLKKVANLYKLFTKLKLPTQSYPDCEFCSCDQGEPTASAEQVVQESGETELYQQAEESGANSILSPLLVSTSYNETDPAFVTTNDSYEALFAGQGFGVSGSTLNPLTPKTRAPQPQTIESNDPYTSIFTSSLPVYERINLFNTKAKYFNESPTNPGGGVNRIKVSFNTGDGVFHYDNVIALLVKPDNSSLFQAGNIITFQAPVLSNDVNLTGYTQLNQYGTASITGTTINNSGQPITVQYADYNNPNNLLTQVYTSQQDPNDSVYARFPIDIEYFQVITASTYNDFVSMCSSTPNPNSLNERFISNTLNVYKFTRTVSNTTCGGTYEFNYTQQNQSVSPITSFNDFTNQKVVFLVRGVDPNTTRQTCSYDLSILYGYNTFGVNGYTVTGNYKLNHPVKPGFKNVQHNIGSNTTLDSYSNNYLFHNSYHFMPSAIGNTAGFSAFTSSTIRYYSRLDGNNMTFKPSPSSPMLTTGFDNSFNGVKVNSNNVFERDYSDLTGNTYTLNTTNNDGYYDGEIVEGGSALYGTFPTSYQTCGLETDSLFTTNSFLSLYYAPTYPTGTTISYGLGGNGNQIVMRSDRLPTSTTTQTNIDNSFPLQSNLLFSAFNINDDGSSVSYIVSTAVPTGSNQDTLDNSDEPSIIQEVFSSFDCGSMVPLKCYKEGPNNTLVLADDNDNCYKYAAVCGGANKMTNGCYTFVTVPLISLPCELINLSEWSTRLSITFGACRNVFSHLFTNNWINGVLYAFSFKNDVVYSSPLSNNPNQLQSAFYCKDVVILHPTNNYYYRSSPYVESNDSFVGKKSRKGIFGSYKGNEYNLQYPTTMLDLGPRADYLQEIILSDGFDGYVSNKLNTTSYSDVSDIFNLFIVTRLVNNNFIEQILTGAGAGMESFFSRPNNMVDADYAQSISINSEFGVAPFESSNYTQPGQIYVSSLSGDDPLFGIFFTSDTQNRDYITPKRTILNPNVPINNNCGFNEFGVFTQKVPMYQWGLTPNTNSIFGSQKNNWYTTGINGNQFFAHDYQSLDRLLQSSRYFRPSAQNQNDFFKGYIYSVDGSGNLSWVYNSKWPNTPVPDAITVGAPFHFYFGLKRGKSAYDRFLSKWVDTNKVVL